MSSVLDLRTPARATPDGEPWFGRRGLLLGIALGTPPLACALVWIGVWLDLSLAGLVLVLLGWGLSFYAIALFACVWRARKTYALACQAYPPPIHPPMRMPYVVVFVVLSLLAFGLNSPAPTPKREYHHVHAQRGPFGGPVVPNVAAEAAGGVVHGTLQRAERGLAEAAADLASGAGLIFVVLPLLVALYSGRKRGVQEGLWAAQAREPPAGEGGGTSAA